MKNIVIAVGGTGTKIATALVRLLTLGFPIDSRIGTLTSFKEGESLDVWRLDLDGHSGAAADLAQAFADYAAIRRAWGSRWSLEVRQPETIDPVESLNGVSDLLGFVGRGRPLLDAFYRRTDLTLDITHGLYAKPVIGVMPMAQLAEGALKERLERLGDAKARFFIVSSLHGGTGASGAPVLASLLDQLRRPAGDRPGKDWTVEAVYATPYEAPPDPTAGGGDLTRAGFFPTAVTQDELSRMAERVDQGYYSKTETAIERAQAAFTNITQTAVKRCDRTYLVGKPEWDRLPAGTWANEGASQRNPVNSAEVVAALAILRSVCTEEPGSGRLLLVSAREGLGSTMRLHDLPVYEVGNDLIEAEKVVLALGVLRLLLMPDSEVGWSTGLGGEADFKWLKNCGRLEDTRSLLGKGFDSVARAAESLFQGASRSDGTRRPPLGWHADLWPELSRFFEPETEGARIREVLLRFPGRQPRLGGLLGGRNRAGQPLAFGLRTASIGQLSFVRPEWTSQAEVDLGIRMRHAQTDVIRDLVVA